MANAEQVWPAPITAQASDELDRVLDGVTDEANEVLLAVVIAGARRIGSIDAA